jgi:DNA-binding NtrC family response regulator
MSGPRLLLVDDEPEVRHPIRRFFVHKNYEVQEAGSLAEAVSAFQTARPDLCLLDYSLPDGDGLELLVRMKALDASVPAIVLTAHGSIDLAVKAVKEGAEQFFTKPVELPALLLVVERLLETRRMRQVTEAGRSRRAREAVDPFQGESPPMKRLAEQARRVAQATTPVLLLGETGSGKGVLAREDLYYRIRGVSLVVPPLRERGPDVVLLARRLVDRIGADIGRSRVKLSAGAEKAIQAHTWPGNVRELRNVLEHGVLLAPRSTLEAEDLREGLAGRPEPRTRPRTLEEAEREHVEQMLRRHSWAVPLTAQVLGISRSSLYEKIKKHGIAVPRLRG